MMHILAFDSSINSASLTQLASVADQMVPKSSSGSQTPATLNKVGCVWFQGATVGRGQLQSPALRNQPFPTFDPVNIGVKTMSPVRAAYMWDQPLVLNPFDELDAFATNAAGGAEHDRAFAILFDNMPQKISGPFLRVRWTSSTTLGAGAWTACPITFDTAL